MKKRQKEKKLRQEENSKILSLTIGFLIAVLAVVQVLISNRLASFGEKLKDQEIEISQLSQKNLEIKKELSQSRSLGELTEAAKELGLTPANSIIYLTPEIPVALK